MQVAYEYEIFQNVPRWSPGGGKEGSFPGIRASELASLVKTDEAFLVRIMRLLAVDKIFVEVDEEVFANTKLFAGMAEELVAGHLGSLLNDVYKASCNLADAMFGMSMYDYFEKNVSPDRVRMAKSMAVSAREELKELAIIFHGTSSAKWLILVVGLDISQHV